MAVRSRSLPTTLLTALALLLCPSLAAAQGRTIVVHSPVGHQYLTFGAEAGLWIGAGSLRALPEGATEPGALVAEGVDLAIPAGPLSVGIAHVLRPNLMFEARLGGGATVFFDDRFVSMRLAPQGDLHVAWTLDAEILARGFTDTGWTLAFASHLATLGLPDGRGSYLRLGPRVGWIGFDETFDHYTLVELGVSLPLINGLIPDFNGVRTAPIDVTWTMVGLYVGWGM